jgi:preprotein translocase subunit SecF
MPNFAQFGNQLYTGERSLEIVRRQRIWYAFSAVLLLISLGALATRGLTLGLEFKGGSEFQITRASTTADLVGSRAVTDVVPAAQPKVTKIGTDSVRVQVDRLDQTQTTAVRNSLAKAYGVTESQVTASFVGPSWGSTISDRALRGLIVFLVLVSAFIAIYFRTWKMAVAAIVALLHDLIITVGIYSLVGFEVTPASVIGFLTILGYSLYDTVVVFDKVRENTDHVSAQSQQTFSEAANLAVNQTLVRSINTSVVALLPVAAILFIGAFLLGAGTLKDLSLALFVGIATGTYSSIFIATPLLADLREREPQHQALAKRILAKRAGAPASTGSRGGTALLERDEQGDGGGVEGAGIAAGGIDGAAGRAAGGGSAAGTGTGASARATGPRNQPVRRPAKRGPKGRK